jgi:hypothetical protein
MVVETAIYNNDVWFIDIDDNNTCDVGLLNGCDVGLLEGWEEGNGVGANERRSILTVSASYGNASTLTVRAFNVVVFDRKLIGSIATRAVLQHLVHTLITLI